MRKLVVMVMLMGCGSASPVNETDAPLNENDGGGSDDGGGGGDGGGSGVDPTWYRSGSRIKMIVLNTPDGAKQFNGWRDVTRNEDCSFVPTSDGMTRCLPTPVPQSATIFDYALFHFADAACTMPVVRLPASCSPLPTYILTATVSGCQTSITYTAVNQRGQMYTSAYQRSGANCTSTAPDPMYVFYGLGAAVPLSSFQTATRAVE